MSALDQSAAELRQGATRVVLLTGSEGSGRSCALRAAGCRLAALPHGLHWQHLSCKTLKGKASDGVARVLDTHLAECLWRSPALLTLDDLDALAPNPDESAVADNPMLSVHVEKLTAGGHVPRFG